MVGATSSAGSSSMTLFARHLSRTAALMSLLATAGGLSGCILVTDTSRMNPDVFVQETAPVFLNPAQAAQVPVQPQPVPERQPIPQKRDLYQTQFHQTYGIPVSNPVHRVYYASIRDDGFTLPAIPYSRIDARYLRQEVDYRTNEAPGTIVVDTKARFLYLVQPNGKAIRYGVGIGRDGFAWSGRGTIQWKAKWPRWTPPNEMVQRQPELAKFCPASTIRSAPAPSTSSRTARTRFTACTARRTGSRSARQPRPAAYAC